jgi:hypothetical protein
VPNFDGAVCAVIPHAYGTIKFPLPTQSHRLDPAIPESSPDRSRSQARQRRKPAISSCVRGAVHTCTKAPGEHDHRGMGPITASEKRQVGRIRGWLVGLLHPHVQEGSSRRIFWRKIWTSFLLSSCSFCSSEGAAIGDIGGGDNSDMYLLSLRRTEPPMTG